jgi:hypothetical protein
MARQRTAGGDIPLRQPDIAGFPFLGEQISLLMRQQGICKPRQLEAALAIRTTWTADSDIPPYQDAEGPDGLFRYAYRGTDPQSFDNVALRRAYELRLPLIWFIAVAPGVFRALHPVFVVADEPASCGWRWPSTRANASSHPRPCWPTTTGDATCSG